MALEEIYKGTSNALQAAFVVLNQLGVKYPIACWRALSVQQGKAEWNEAETISKQTNHVFLYFEVENDKFVHDVVVEVAVVKSTDITSGEQEKTYTLEKVEVTWSHPKLGLKNTIYTHDHVSNDVFALVQQNDLGITIF